LAFVAIVIIFLGRRKKREPVPSMEFDMIGMYIYFLPTSFYFSPIPFLFTSLQEVKVGKKGNLELLILVLVTAKPMLIQSKYKCTKEYGGKGRFT